MADAASSTHKRKASSPEAEAPNPSSSSSEKHDSKKARKDPSEKQHAEDCEDPDCEGCAEGEIVLQFDTKPNAVELFQMAREEASKGEGAGTIGTLSRMAKALFDKAIEEFEILERAEAHIEINDGTEVGGKVLETRVQHAACVVAVGNAVPSTEMLQAGTRMGEELVRRTDSGDGHVLVGLGIAQISQVRRMKYLAFFFWSLLLGQFEGMKFTNGENSM